MDCVPFAFVLLVYLFYSQNNLVELLGVSFTSIYRWEKEVYEPTTKVKKKLRELFI